MTQTLFDLPQARDARDAGIATVDGNAPDLWKSQAGEAIRRVCERQAEFICDDVWAELAAMNVTEGPPEPRALGPVVLQAARRGLCERTGRYKPSANVSCHGNPRGIWRSLIYRGGLQ